MNTYVTHSGYENRFFVRHKLYIIYRHCSTSKIFYKNSAYYALRRLRHSPTRFKIKMTNFISHNSNFIENIIQYCHLYTVNRL